jgi:small conductance mechanosensitive channel
MFVFAQSANPPLTEGLIRTGLVLVLAVVSYAVTVRIGRRLVRDMAKKGAEAGARAETLWLVIRRVVLIGIIVTTVLVLFSVWGFSLTPLVAVSAAFAAALGFGAQDLIKDFISGFFILVEDQFHVGDTITIVNTTGQVEDIQLRVTVLRDLEGNVHYIPNGQIVVTSNFTSQYAQPIIDVGISYSTDVDRALAVMKDELSSFASDPEWSNHIRGDAEILGVNKLDDSAVVLRGRLTTAADQRWNVRREALRRLKNRFDAEGINIPFPQVTVHKGD